MKYLGPREDIWKCLEDFYVCEVGKDEMGGLFAESHPFNLNRPWRQISWDEGERVRLHCLDMISFGAGSCGSIESGW